MKIKFWKHTTELWLAWMSLFIASLAVLIAGIILTIVKNIAFASLILLGFISIIYLTINIFFIEKKFTSRVIFSEKGIEVTHFKKSITFIAWNDIVRIKEITRVNAINWLSFVSSNNQIDISLTKKIYNTIMLICPINSIKFAINNINSYKCFHKKDNIIK